jgi:hypothetical protein
MELAGKCLLRIVINHRPRFLRIYEILINTNYATCGFILATKSTIKFFSTLLQQISCNRLFCLGFSLPLMQSSILLTFSVSVNVVFGLFKYDRSSSAASYPGQHI